MHRQPNLRWIYAAAAIAASLAGGYFGIRSLWLSQASFLLRRTYTETRPFRFRLPDNGYSSVQDQRDRSRSATLLQAVVILRRAQRVFPENAEVYRLLGRAAFLDRGYDQAVSHYQHALQGDPQYADTRAELAGVLLVRAQQQQRPVDLAMALEEIGRATRLEANAAVASCNLALIYEAIPAPHLARDEWQHCQTLESDPRWRSEAGSHLSAMRALLIQRADRFARLSGGPASFLKASSEKPYLPETALDTAVADWLPVSAADASARHGLELVASQSSSGNGDTWLLDLLRLAPSAAVQSAHSTLAAAMRANQRGHHEDAMASAGRARQAFQQIGSRAGEFRARFEYVYALHRKEQSSGCLEEAKALFRDLQPTRYSWLKAQAWLEQTTCESQLGDSGRLVSEREQGLAWIRHTGYEGLALRAMSFLLQPDLVRANPVRLWRITHEGLDRFWASEFTAVRAQQFYFAAALGATDQGFPFAATAMAREGLTVMEEMPNPEFRALCTTTLGTAEMAAGLDAKAKETFSRAEKAFAQCEQTATVRLHSMQAMLFRAEAETMTGDAAAVVHRLEELRTQAPSAIPPDGYSSIEQTLGLAYLRLGRADQALPCFRQVAGSTRNALRHVTDRSQRDGLLDVAAPAFRAEIQLELVHARSPEKAFSLWQQWRRTRIAEESTAPASLVPPGIAVLAITSLPGGVAVFAADSSGVEAKWLPGGKDSLDAAARQFTTLCSSPASSEDQIDHAGRALYDTLIRPFERRLLSQRILAISADGGLNNIPWYALRDGRGRLLLERQTIVLSSEFTASSRASQKSGEQRPLVVASPAIPADLAGAYPPLGDSSAEGRRILSRYPKARVLTGKDATVQAVKGFLPQSAFFHFGGHGMTNGGYGAILLAAEPGEDHGGVLGGPEIAELNLRGVRVASLASCSSGVGELMGPVNPESLVRALLDAGTGNVIAAPWTVDSETTAALFGDFYDLLSANGSVSEALREACKRTRLRPGARHPHYWAGFQAYGIPN